jgi:23S rRNA (cytidine1920-2'-O)/16S rRNA (cytidine1409-2'-O)-methyltransferase
MKKRLDILVFEKGLAETRTKAQALIMAGNVLVGGEPATKAGVAYDEAIDISLKNVNPYVSRGGLKLENALKDLSIDVEGLTCLDIGASTGGFTDCLLQHGAVKVYAVDVGTSQLHEKLKNDPRVISLENVNFRYFDNTQIKEEIDFIVIDVSFISLDKILPEAVKISGKILAMVKPQFELTPAEVKKGVVKDGALRQKAIDKIKVFAESLGLKTSGEAESKVKGPKGNIEHFILLEK